MSAGEGTNIRVDGNYGFAGEIVLQNRNITRVSNVVGFNGWKKHDIEGFIVAVRGLEAIMTGIHDSKYREHVNKAKLELNALHVEYPEDRRKIYNIWHDLWSDLMDLCVRRHPILSKTGGLDDWTTGDAPK